MALCLVAVCVIAPVWQGREDHDGAANRWHFVPWEGRAAPMIEEEARAEEREKGGGFLTRALGRMERPVEGSEVDGARSGRSWSEVNGLTRRLNFSHNLSRVFPSELYATHPEFFPLVDGVRWKPVAGPAYWNPDLGREDVARFAAEAARRYFESNPDAVSFALGTNDGLTFGESEETLELVAPAALGRGGARNVEAEQGGDPVTERAVVIDNTGYAGAWFRERPDFSRLVFTFMNRAAVDLAKTHPEKYVGALAYYWSENAPDFPLHPQVLPYLTADRSQGYDRKFWEEERSLQRRWGARAGAPRRVEDFGFRVGPERGLSGGDSRPVASGSKPDAEIRGLEAPEPESGTPPRRMGIYDYLYGNGFLVPRVHTKLIAEHLRHARRAGFTDYYAEVNPNWGLDGPMPWLVAQLLRDPEQSREVLLETYYAECYGAAAVPMRRFFETCERQWMIQRGGSYWLKHYRNESQAQLFPAAVRGRLRGWLEAAERGARSDEERAGVGLVSAAFGVTERFAAMQEARDAVNEGALRGVVEWRILAARLEAWWEARDEFERYATRVRAEQPLAVSPFNWADYMRNDPTTAAVAGMRQAAERAGEVEAAVGVLRRMAGGAMLAGMWDALGAEARAKGRELLRGGALSGALKPGRNVAGLNYGLPLPEGWLSRVEPAEFFRAEMSRTSETRAGTSKGEGAGEGRVLRLTGNKETLMFQWNPAVDLAWHIAEVEVRASVGTGTVVLLTLDWLDAAEQRVGLQTHRLPEGEWNEEVTLRLAAQPPVGARWVGVGLRVQHQREGDWVEARGFTVRAVTGAE